MAITAVLYPTYKKMLIEFYFLEIYSSMDANRNITLVRESINELYNEYVTMHTSSLVGQNIESNSQASSSSGAANEGIRRSVVSGRSNFESFVRIGERTRFSL